MKALAVLEGVFGVLAGLAGMGMLVAFTTLPLYSYSTGSISANGQETTTSGTATLLQAGGAEPGFWVIFAILLAMAASVAFAAVRDACAPHNRWFALLGGLLATTFVLACLGAFTIGMFLLPMLALTFVAMLLAMIRRLNAPAAAV